MKSKLIIAAIELIGIIGTVAMAIGGRALIGYLILNPSYYKLSEQDIGMSEWSSIIFIFSGFGFILISIILWRHEQFIGKI